MNLVEVGQNTNDQGYLAFTLDEKNYGFQISKVNEVIVMPEITPMPKAPEYVKGVINLRGLIIPIVDLRTALGMEQITYDKQACVIIVKMIVDVSEKFIGFIVDSVSEVFDIASQNIEDPSNCGISINDEYLLGIAKVKDKIVMLLNIDNIVNY